MKKEFDKVRAPGGVKYDETVDLTPENWVGFNLEPSMLADYGLALMDAFAVGPPMPPLWREMTEEEWQSKREALKQRGLVGMYIRNPEAAYDFLASDGRDGFAEREIWRALHKEYGPDKRIRSGDVVIRFDSHLPGHRP